MKTNTEKRVWVALVVGLLLIAMAAVVTSAAPKVEVNVPTSTVTSATSAPEDAAFVDSTQSIEPPYGALLDKLTESGPGILL